MTDSVETRPAALISYRRSDSQSLTERIGELMANEWGGDSVFIDTEDIPLGTNFNQHIRSSLEASTVVLAMIGNQYLCKSPDADQPRLFEPDDFVRRELEWANANAIPVLPVLLDGARMPAKEKLPESIQFIANINAVHVRPGSDFAFTTFRLLTHLQDSHKFPKPNEQYRWEVALCPIAIFVTCVGVVNSALLTLRFVRLGPAFNADSWLSQLLLLEFAGPLLLGLGPLGIVIAKRWCCLRQARNRRPRFLDGLDETKIKEPSALLGFTLGITSLGWGPISLLPSLFFSIRGLMKIRKHPNVFRGYRYACFGIAVGLLGTFISITVQREAWYIFSGFSAIDRARSHYDSGELDRAEFESVKACNLLPRHTLPYIIAAKTYLAKANYQGAINASSVVIKDLEARLELINPNLRLTDSKLEQRFEEGILLAEAYDIRAKARGSLGKTTEAESDKARGREVLVETRYDRQTGSLNRLETLTEELNSFSPQSPPAEPAPAAPQEDDQGPSA